MRVTAAQKRETRGRILTAARVLFSERGFHNVTTRDIARAAAIANGTLFNYFATKEAIAAGLAVEVQAVAHARFARRRRRGGSLEEDLFALVAAELRDLKPLRNYLTPIIEVAPEVEAATDAGSVGSVGAAHWAMVVRILAEHGIEVPPSFVTMQLHRSLYMGVLAFWSSDGSPNQEDTLAVLDHSLKAFVGSLPAPNSPGS